MLIQVAQLAFDDSSGVYLIFMTGEKTGKQPAIMTLSQYICICTHLRTVGKMTRVTGDFRRLAAFK